MKPIEELAKECGGYIETGENDEQLEALCKAYMQDRLKSLEPVVWQWSHVNTLTKEVLSFGHSLTKVAYTDNAFWDNPPHTVSTIVTELYDISSLLEKK